MSDQTGRYPMSPQQAAEGRARAFLGVGDHRAGGRVWDIPAHAPAPPAAPVPGFLEALWSQEERLGRKVIRPEVVTNPRHDVHGHDPEGELDEAARLRELLGEQHFEQPEPEDQAREDDGKLHLIGELARQLNVKSDTIRHWQRFGILPEADHFSAGSGKYRKRFFTSAQINGLVEIHRDERVTRANINSTRFSERAFALWAELASSPAPADHG